MVDFVSLYLTLFNAGLVIGWAQVLYLALSSIGPCGADTASDVVPTWFPFANGQYCGWTIPENAEKAYDLLYIFQGLSILEVMHPLVGLIKTGVFSTFIQVLSRLLYVYLVAGPIKDQVLPKGFFWTLCFAWSLTEVVRYSWYAIKQATDWAPFPLTWCRYTFFFVLYPLGVYSENVAMLVNIDASPYDSEKSNILNKYGMWFALALYTPGFPFLYMHMIKQRKKVLSPKKKAEPKPERGVCFPKDGPEGTIKTSISGAKIIAAALRGAGKTDLADAADKAAKKWRFGYLKHYTKMVYASAESPKVALDIASSGAKYMHERFRFVDEKGKETTFKAHMDGMKASKDTPFHIGTINGDAGDPPSAWKVPYTVYPAAAPTDAQSIQGAALEKQCDDWARYGTIEPDCAQAIKDVVKNPEWMDLRGHTFVLIGAGSAMGPFPKLMELGATVVALDIPGSWGFRAGKKGYRGPWSRLIDLAKKGSGKLIFPLSKPQKECTDDEDLYRACGSNLTEQPGEILNWLLKAGVCDGPVTIGNYTYLDSDMHVKLSLSADAIIEGLIEKKKSDVRVAFLCTPTDLHVIPKEAYADAKANASMARFKYPFEFFFSKVTGQLKSNCMKVAANDTCIVDGISVAQGPNYALAKRLQHWRAMMSYDAGCIVSTNIAPSTATASVVSNITFKWAYGGMPFFKPYEIFWQETTNAVMAAMLVHDVRNPKASANPDNRKNNKLDNPLELFKFGGFHGGVWRAGYKVDSLGMPSVLIHFLGGPTLALAVSYALSVGSAYYFSSDMFFNGGFMTDMKALMA